MVKLCEVARLPTLTCGLIVRRCCDDDVCIGGETEEEGRRHRLAMLFAKAVIRIGWGYDGEILLSFVSLMIGNEMNLDLPGLHHIIMWHSF